MLSLINTEVYATVKIKTKLIIKINMCTFKFDLTTFTSSIDYSENLNELSWYDRCIIGILCFSEMSESLRYGGSVLLLDNLLSPN